ncbi:MAG: preprotein translocase subunit SecY [Firmicutes bacterium]|nr:preprotein translocase subunit SecY [Bacillota bacterium]
MFKTLVQAFKQKDTRRKIIITLALLLVFRIGAFIPIPGINPGFFYEAMRGAGEGASDFLFLLSGLSGGALEHGAILALGVGPYITSSIVMQLLTIAIPGLERLSKQGDEGRRKIAVYTRYMALVMSLAQAIAIVWSLGLAGDVDGQLFGEVPTIVTAMIVVLVLTAGAMFTVWIGDKITEHGVGNGMSMLIFVGIISSGALAFFVSLQDVVANIANIVTPIVFIVTLALIFFFIVYVDLAERRIPVTYAKQIKGNKMYGGQSANIPMKINAVGVIPIIFAFSILNFPQLIMAMVAPNGSAIQWYSANMGTGTWPNIVLMSLLILGFSYFYASLSFNPEDVSRQIQQQGGFILGFRPGVPTRDYLRRVHNRITLFGALFLMVIALVPSLIFNFVTPGNALNNAFTSIALLIIVSVALEFDKQLQAQMLAKTYKGFLK